MKTNKRTVKTNSFKGKKIWELSDLYHCPIIGTCFKESDLKKLIKKSELEIPVSTTDYEIHSILVSSMNRRSKISRNAQKMLETKYSLTYRRIHKITDEKECYKAWRESVANTRFSGVFWAIISHPVFSYDFITKIYREFHLLSHDVVSSLHEKSMKLNTLSDKNKKLELSLKDLKLDLKSLSCENQALKKENLEMNTSLKDKDELISTLDTEENSSSELEISKYKSELIYVKQKSQRRKHKINDLLDENEALRKKLEDLESLYEQKSREYLALESNLSENMKNDEFLLCDGDCDSCEYNNISNKRILYVGGINSTVVKCRKVVEDNGGIFEHHDGGLENAKSRLPRMLMQADFIFSPVDNVSHGASYMIKKICKQYNKNYVFLRSSGLSSFIKEMSEISEAI